MAQNIPTIILSLFILKKFGFSHEYLRWIELNIKSVKKGAKITKIDMINKMVIIIIIKCFLSNTF